MFNLQHSEALLKGRSCFHFLVKGSVNAEIAAMKACYPSRDVSTWLYFADFVERAAAPSAELKTRVSRRISAGSSANLRVSPVELRASRSDLASIGVPDVTAEVLRGDDGEIGVVSAVSVRAAAEKELRTMNLQELAMLGNQRQRSDSELGQNRVQ